MSINCESCAVFEPLSLSSVQFRAVDVVLCSTWSVDMMTWLKRSSWEIRWTCRIWRDVIGNVVTNLMIFRLWTTVQRDVLGMISMWLHMGMTWYMIWPRTTAAYNPVLFIFTSSHFFHKTVKPHVTRDRRKWDVIWAWQWRISPLRPLTSEPSTLLLVLLYYHLPSSQLFRFIWRWVYQA